VRIDVLASGDRIMSGSQSLWMLDQGEALSLTIGPGQRELSVAEGRLWLTQQGSAEQPAQDVWLEPGQSVQLASGSKVVVEAWPVAQFQLLVPPAACPELAQRRRAQAGSARAASWSQRASAGLATA
jgi:hypothetical protein